MSKSKKTFAVNWPFGHRLRFMLMRLFRRLNYEAGLKNRLGEQYDFYLNLSKRGGSIVHAGDYFKIDLGPHQCFVRKDSSDADVFNQVYIVGEYAPLLDMLKINGLEVKTIIDAGANIGLTTLLLNKTFPDASIISLEPDAGNFTMLEKNTKEFGTDRVQCIQAGVSAMDGRLAPENSFRDSREWSKSFSPQVNKSEEGIAGYSVNTLMARFGFTTIDLMKIDIEGGERFLFGSDPATYAFLDKVNIICIEIHDEFDCRAHIYDVLSSFKFWLFNAGELTIGVKSTFWTR